MEQNKKRDIFYGIVAIATLIVALIGATLAYFSITVESAPGAVNAGSKIVEISYDDNQNIAQADELIPADFTSVVKKAYMKNVLPNIDVEGVNKSNLCVDRPGLDENGNPIEGRQVCSVYRFTISNKGTSDFSIIAAVNSELNSFVNNEISYALYDVDYANLESEIEQEKGWVKLDGVSETLGMTYCDNSNVDDTKKCFTMSGTPEVKSYINNSNNKATNYLFNENNPVEVKQGQTKTYDLIIYLKETYQEQNSNLGKKYNGTIRVELAGSNLGIDSSGQITGKFED